MAQAKKWDKKMTELLGNIRTNFLVDIDNGNAIEVNCAHFAQGEEGEIITRFYRLWGRTVREVQNRRNTETKYFWVDGENLDTFNAYYPA